MGPRPGFRVGSSRVCWKSVSGSGGRSPFGLESGEAQGRSDRPLLQAMPEAMAPTRSPVLVPPPCHHSREGGCCKTDNRDQAQAHTGLIPAVLGAFAEHVPYPPAGAIGAVGEVAGAQFLPDHGCRRMWGGLYREKERGPLASAGLDPVSTTSSNAHPQFHCPAQTEPLNRRAQSASSTHTTCAGTVLDQRSGTSVSKCQFF